MGLEKVHTPVERRAKKRFVMEREIRYRVLEQDKIIAVGSGKTINLSSNGVAFVAENDLPEGAYIEVSIAWPALPTGHAGAVGIGWPAHRHRLRERHYGCRRV